MLYTGLVKLDSNIRIVVAFISDMSNTFSSLKPIQPIPNPILRMSLEVNLLLTNK